MNNSKKLTADIAMLYYKKNYTQQQIADMMNLSRQTVSKILNDAVKNNVVDIIIHNPEADCMDLENKICEKYNIKKAVVLSAESDNELYRSITAVNGAVDYLLPLLKDGDKKIGISWGRTIEALINEFPDINTTGNIVFPLFGATDTDKTYFSSNELARNFSRKLSSDVKYAWFPYLTASDEDEYYVKKTSCYRETKELWDNIDIAIIGIGNKSVFDLFSKTFGIQEQTKEVAGDIATHFFNKDGEFDFMYGHNLCATVENIKGAKDTIAVVCGDDKILAIDSALKTGVIDVLITDEYTAKRVLNN